MHFCATCQNMYYIRVDNDNPNKLIYYCRNCGNEDDLLMSENTTISKTNVKKGQQTFSTIINKYTKLDPTLPRVNNVLCPNADCCTNKKKGGDSESCEEREILYIRYDDINMKYVYLCSSCDTVWKTEEHV
jgi:DNA-directed RNA polymerase subunit M/transcription elongation factor TFIIS